MSTLPRAIRQGTAASASNGTLGVRPASLRNHRQNHRRASQAATWTLSSVSSTQAWGMHRQAKWRPS
eukprot:8956828-Lingulodinium_polyedra.AAC.1